MSFFEQQRERTRVSRTHKTSRENASLLSTQKRERDSRLDWKRERERERRIFLLTSLAAANDDEENAPKRSDDRRRGNDGVGRTGSRIRRHAGRRVRRRLWRVRRMSREARTPNTTVVECIIIIPVVVVVVVVFGPDVRRVGENVRFGGSLSRAVYRDRPAATAVSW